MAKPRYGVKDAWWFWRHLPVEMKLLPNLVALGSTCGFAAFFTFQQPLFGLNLRSLALYWLALLIVLMPVALLAICVAINRHPYRMEELQAWVLRQESSEAPD